MKCICGCGGSFKPSRSTKDRIKAGKDVGYLPGHHVRGVKNYNWKGGIFIDGKGYRFILMPDHPNARKSGYVAESHLVMSKKIKRPINTNTEIVHHVNGDKLDNRIENLNLVTRVKHGSVHHPKGVCLVKREPKICRSCGNQFIKNYIGNHHRDQYCSRKCMHRFMTKENACNAKLKQKDVDTIRDLAETHSQRHLAKLFNISKSQIGRIIRRESW